MRTILHRYIFREVSAPFLLGLIVFTSVLLMSRLLKLADMVVGNGVSIADILLLLLYLMPSFCAVTIPMSYLLAVLLAFGRLSGDSEITAMKSVGMGLSGLLPPVLFTAFLAWAATTFMTVTALPWGQTAFKQHLQKIIESRARLDLKAGVFNDQFPGIVMFVSKFDREAGTMEGIIVHDEREGEVPSTVFATRGQITREPGTHSVHLHLSDGSIHREMPNLGYRLATFADYDLLLNFGKQLNTPLLDEKTMTLTELRQNMRYPLSAKLRSDIQIEYHRRLALPWACFIFALIGIPFGIQNRRSGKSAGFAVSIGVFTLYYILLTAGTALTERGLIPAILGEWLPNLVLIFPGIYLVRKTVADEEIGIIERVRALARPRRTVAGTSR